jgi:hypothetical protein
MVTLQFCEHCHSLFKAPPSNIQRPRFSICQFAHTTPCPGLKSLRRGYMKKMSVLIGFGTFWAGRVKCLN